MVQASNLCSRELFGGAMELAIPAAMADVSDIRPVPDNQEVWANGEESLIIEIVERATCADSDAGRFFWSDLASMNDSGASTLQREETLDAAQDLPRLPPRTCPHACIVSGTQLLTKSRQHASDAQAVDVCLAVVRLPGVQSDVLITAHAPQAEPQAGQQQEGLGGPGLVRQMLRTLAVHDWGLFG